jgi:hypothetical protein
MERAALRKASQRASTTAALTQMMSHTAMASRGPIAEKIVFTWGQSDQNQIKLKTNQENVRPRENAT